jgi:hypothetical protein
VSGCLNDVARVLTFHIQPQFNFTATRQMRFLEFFQRQQEAIRREFKREIEYVMR